MLVLTGDLGAGKTTLTQAIAEGLGVRGPITSPTFVIARVHPSLVGGPALVHVDAYRLGSAIELDDLDLDADLDASVTIVEWGAGLAEQLSETRLELTITGDDVRTAHLVGVGDRGTTSSTPSRPRLTRRRRVRTVRWPRTRARGIRPRVRDPARARIA